MSTNAQRQATFRKKMQQAGKNQLLVWVDPAQRAAILAFLAEGAFPVANPPSRPVRLPASQGKTRKKRDAREAWQIRNDELWALHQAEIRRRHAAGEKPSEIAAWFNTLGFTGSGATLNGYLRSA